MDQKGRSRIAVLVSVIIVLAVFASFGYTIFSSQPPSVTLPSLPVDSSAATSTPPADNQLLRVEVTLDTVQAVVASLSREGSYYRQLSADTFWSGGSSTVTAQAWVDGGYTYVRSVLPGGQVRYTLTDGGTLYYWYEGDEDFRTAPAGSLSADLSQSIPTYEDVLSLPQQSISGAGYGRREEQSCIYVETAVDELGYLERYWVSVDNGLLIAAETVKGSSLVYSMSATTLQTPCPAGTSFALPDGTILHET